MFGLRAPIAVSWNIDRAEAVGLGPAWAGSRGCCGSIHEYVRCASPLAGIQFYMNEEFARAIISCGSDRAGRLRRPRRACPARPDSPARVRPQAGLRERRRLEAW